jgi:hypothetical protein
MATLAEGTSRNELERYDTNILDLRGMGGLTGYRLLVWIRIEGQ